MLWEGISPFSILLCGHLTSCTWYSLRHTGQTVHHGYNGITRINKLRVDILHRKNEERTVMNLVGFWIKNLVAWFLLTDAGAGLQKVASCDRASNAACHFILIVAGHWQSRSEWCKDWWKKPERNRKLLTCRAFPRPLESTMRRKLANKGLRVKGHVIWPP